MGKKIIKFPKLLAELSQSGELGIYIFGTGLGGKTLLEHLRDYKRSTGINCIVKGFFDNNPSKQGTMLDEIMITAPKVDSIGVRDYVFIASFDYGSSMQSQLLKLGLENDKIICPNKYLSDLLITDRFKYDIKMDANCNNSQSVILSHINPGSSVLEVGTATGYMTKYLKEELNCSVTGIEVFEEAALKAGLYADKMVIADLDKMNWVDKLENKNFDYIIFADVLEHLRKPYEVFNNAMKFLNQGGQVIASIPNIAHNAIIMELMEDKFHYHSTGLLDDTHIFFFTENTVKDLFDSNGLEIYSWEKVAILPRDTEFKQEYDNFPTSVKDFLLKRINGHTYQFVVFAKARIDLIRGNKIIFFGTGLMSQNIFKRFPFKVEYFVDHDSEKWNCLFNDLMIYNPKKLLQESKENMTIIVCSPYYIEIARQLMKMGFKENVHFFDGYFFENLPFSEKSGCSMITPH
jgi:2-polyprenyl-3-methyl-5-hydroxy-6-metoxy-1,4-benzoquinol methylase